jgi:hypothetical protein
MHNTCHDRRCITVVYAIPTRPMHRRGRYCNPILDGMCSWQIIQSTKADQILQTLAWCMCAIVGVERNEGLGVYKGNRKVDAQHLAKLVIINNNLWAVAVNVTKASILAQYLRLFSSRSTRFVCYFLLLLLIPVLCWSVFAGTFLCTPVAKLWKPQLTGHCMNARQYWLSAAAINIGMDFTVLLLPLPAITQLHLPRKQKFCLILMFLLGFFVCVVSVVRITVVDYLEGSGRLVGKFHSPTHAHQMIQLTPPSFRIRHSSRHLVRRRSQHRHHLRLAHSPQAPLTTLLPSPARRYQRAIALLAIARNANDDGRRRHERLLHQHIFAHLANRAQLAGGERQGPSSSSICDVAAAWRFGDLTAGAAH